MEPSAQMACPAPTCVLFRQWTGTEIQGGPGETTCLVSGPLMEATRRDVGLCLAQPDVPPTQCQGAPSSSPASGTVGHVPWALRPPGAPRASGPSVSGCPGCATRPLQSVSFPPRTLDAGLRWVPSFPPQGLVEALLRLRAWHWPSTQWAGRALGLSPRSPCPLIIATEKMGQQVPAPPCSHFPRTPSHGSGHPRAPRPLVGTLTQSSVGASTAQEWGVQRQTSLPGAVSEPEGPSLALPRGSFLRGASGPAGLGETGCRVHGD